MKNWGHDALAEDERRLLKGVAQVRLSQLVVLDQHEIETVHARSLKILEEAGVRVHDPECRAALAKAGAKTEPNGERVYLPGRLVEQCLGTAPSRFSLYRRDGTAVEVGVDSRIFGSLVIDPWVIDYPTAKPRRPVLSDVVRHARLGDALENVDFLYRMDMPPEDEPGDFGYLATLEAFLVNTSKPMLAAPASRQSLQHWLEAAEIMAGGRPLAERPPLASARRSPRR